MKEEYINFYSQQLGRNIEMLVVGHSGKPVLTFPTSMGRYYQNKDFKLIDSISWFIENGLVKVYCIDSIDAESWYNKSIHPAERAWRHMQYDAMLRQELVPRVQAECNVHKIAVAGCSFGAYHATNFGFRYPEITSFVFNMGGAFDIKMQLDGYYDDNCYYNNPPDFIPNMENPAVYDMGIVLGVGSADFCLQANIRLSNILHQKGIDHWLDIRQGANHDWPVWREMFPDYIARMF